MLCFSPRGARRILGDNGSLNLLFIDCYNHLLARGEHTNDLWKGPNDNKRGFTFAFSLYSTRRHFGNRPKCKCTFNKARISYYAGKDAATFQLFSNAAILVILSGDVEPNPGSVKNPCVLCRNPIAKTHRRISCDTCKELCHIGPKCGNICQKHYKQLQSKTCSPWKCPSCRNVAEINISACLPLAECQDLESFFGDPLVKVNDETEIGLQAEDRPLACHYEQLLQQRNKDPGHVLVCHLNINSVQNKFEEL